jgi:prepilin-type N-terminal cleavage/methylation domain-containing protein
MFAWLWKRFRNEQGITLVELLVVVAIVAILAVGAFFTFEGVQQRAVDGRAVALFDQVRRVLIIARTQEGNFPGPPGASIAWPELARLLETYERVPASADDPAVNLQAFSYQRWVDGAANPGFTMIGQARGGTPRWLCADPTRVRSGLGTMPALNMPCP